MSTRARATILLQTSCPLAAGTIYSLPTAATDPAARPPPSLRSPQHDDLQLSTVDETCRKDDTVVLVTAS